MKPMFWDKSASRATATKKNGSICRNKLSQGGQYARRRRWLVVRREQPSVEVGG